MAQTPHILITGATSGIGLGMLKTCHAKGWRVTAINRRVDEALEKKYSGVEFHHFDVRDVAAVDRYFEHARSCGNLPTIYFLSAGINKVDNDGNFNLDLFKEVMDINVMGVMHFVSRALPLTQDKPAMFVAASSTTNIFPNPNCLGYWSSKWILHSIFQQLDRRHRGRGVRFKSLVLGPIATNIFVGGKLASKLQMKVRDILTVSVEDSIPPILKFLESGAQALYYPLYACAFFWALRFATMIYPGLYKGSAPSK